MTEERIRQLEEAMNACLERMENSPLSFNPIEERELAIICSELRRIGTESPPSTYRGGRLGQRAAVDELTRDHQFDETVDAVFSTPPGLGTIDDIQFNILVEEFDNFYTPEGEQMAKTTRRFVYKDERSDKYWEIITTPTSKTYSVKWGKTGTKGTTRSYGPLSTIRFRTEVASKIAQKQAKGYQEVVTSKKKAEPKKDTGLSGEDLIYELDI